jgi:hypothetical protein
LLDEMLTNTIATQLRARGHDVVAVVEDGSLIGLPDEEILAVAAAAGRALVTANIKDLAPVDQRYRASGRSHAGLIFVSTKSFPQDRSFVGAMVAALEKLLGEEGIGADGVTFLPR